ncbi:LLM class flavin-dependent oxidoreductase [Aliiroseovarius sp. Z3]|uniref:MupA/Atu3671 family FMN-dependent luciferase-like monooxygenase n=1 Tax=Aliiroseovarius sp. Z3 TaxID=2811402 RepID=UPI0023B2B0B3|nr:MupA/Atu3671 family FMN-dependent luciferase-like monooxygenase [Aliiroseovarius sp. Z3]MDE9451636.1 LLM class flavin-dependent oxidoreductase [Aliiroseovarius sp. Z3]
MKAVFCGDGTLLAQCADVFAEKGHQIAGIMTDDPGLRHWADGNGHRWIGTLDDPQMSGVTCDYLFSIANTRALPDDVINVASRFAINLHDGPLPQRAGANVPFWSVWEGQKTHAVTWYRLGAGMIAEAALLSASFEIAEGETTFSLNTRCYEAAQASFVDLLTMLETGSTQPEPLGVAHRVYTRTDRPAALGLLNLTTTAEALGRYVRAMDFGTMTNPIGRAKLWTGQQVVMVAGVEVGVETTAPAGTVIDVAADHLTIAAADHNVTLTGLTDLAGGPVDLAPLKGALLPAVENVPDDLLAAVATGEDDWLATLQSGVPAAIPPYPRAHGAGQGMQIVPLEGTPVDADTLVAAWGGWVVGLTGQTAVSLALPTAAPHPALAQTLPITLSVSESTRGADLVGQVQAARKRLRSAVPMAADLPARLGDADKRENIAQALSVVGCDTGAIPVGTAIALTTAPMALHVRDGLFDADVATAIAKDFAVFLNAFQASPDAKLAALPLGAPTPAARLGEAFDHTNRVHEAFAAQVVATPDAPALEVGEAQFTYRELDQAADALAAALAERGAARGKIIGLCLERSADLVIAMLAILKTGAAYLPLDPSYPADRITYMVEDSEAHLIVASASAAARLALDPDKTIFPQATSDRPFDMAGTSEDLFNLIYTSGSTGKPKGVMIPHKTVMNFFTAMDEAVPLTEKARILGVTSVSFDISVLEIFWILSRGATLVLQSDGASETRLPDFSLFYFASEASGSGHHAYRLLLEGARFADENGFHAIWTPERHFHAFGGLYPNPAVAAAAVAGITKNVQLRAGSCVVPLHHPVQIAEDWALVDNLSNGRAGVALASGWQPNDFILNPTNFADRKESMLDSVATLRKLWQGETLSFDGHDGKPVALEIHPRPVQKDIPLWLTAAGNPETFAAAAKLGCGVLTHLLGQSFEEVAEKIRAYRVAWRDAGHNGQGHVVLMLHSFVGDDEDTVRELAREPMKSYLRSSVDLLKKASWTSPLIAERAEGKGLTPQEMFEKEELSPEDLDVLLDHAFDRYYRTSGLFGTPDSAGEIVRRVAEMGVDEIACLIDFGIDTDVVLENLPNIKALMNTLENEGGVDRKATVAEEIMERDITHLQCTPPMATLLAADDAGKMALGHLDVMMVGGEAFPPDLARTIRDAMSGTLLNMYGPTEATIWSSVAKLDRVDERIPLGDPVTNTVLSIRSPEGRELPDLVEGELWIGGEGLAVGYWKRPDLTEERFVETPDGRFYRTGDLVRRRLDGTLEFLGRMDTQVKVRGYRIELGEIEATLAAQPGVQDAVVKAISFGPSDQRLVGYVTADGVAQQPDDLRAALADDLPEFMVPSIIVAMDRMPLTPNGKIDRKALPVPSVGNVSGRIEKAGTEVEETVADIWKTALDLSEVSVTENFFDLGGHSLLVVQVQRLLKDRLHRDVAITDLFRFPTIRGLAAHLSDGGEQKETAASRGAARAAARLARMGRR